MTAASKITANSNGATNVATNGQSNGHTKAAANGHSNGHSPAKALKRPHTDGAKPMSSKRAKFENGLDFIEKLYPMMLEELEKTSQDPSTKVVEFLHPNEMVEMMKKHDFSIAQGPCSNEKLISMCKEIMRYSVKTGHPHFFNQLFGGQEPYGVAGAWLTDTLNASQYTYEVAPVFTMMEKEVLGHMLKIIGFNDGDAIFCPGGSMSNMYAINLARFNKFPEVKESGLCGLPKLCLLTSEKGHYSLKKGAAFLGLGMDGVITVATDSCGRMIPEKLEEAIIDAKAKGWQPFMVNSTAGSTVFGAYDPINAIADICERHELWLHVDGAWGGSVLLSETLRKGRMDGVERADSMTWNPHKLMNAPLQTACFFTKHKNILAEGHSAKAKYLFQQDKFYDVSYDTGDKSVQCGRKVDILKLWTMWKAKGHVQATMDLENAFHCANYLHNKLASNKSFRMVLPKPECTNVCFWYIPPSLQGQEETTEWWAKLAKVAPKIKARMTQQGTLLCGYQPDGDLVNFFRMVVVNNQVDESDMDFVAHEIERLGKDL